MSKNLLGKAKPLKEGAPVQYTSIQKALNRKPTQRDLMLFNFEVMDRASQLDTYLQQAFEEHPVMQDDPTAAKLYNKAHEALFALYQHAASKLP